MTVTAQERQVQLASLVRERDGIERRLADLRVQLTATKERDDKKGVLFLDEEIAMAERRLSRSRDQLELVGGQARTRRAKAETR